MGVLLHRDYNCALYLIHIYLAHIHYSLMHCLSYTRITCITYVSCFLCSHFMTLYYWRPLNLLKFSASSYFDRPPCLLKVKFSFFFFDIFFQRSKNYFYFISSQNGGLKYPKIIVLRDLASFQICTIPKVPITFFKE